MKITCTLCKKIIVENLVEEQAKTFLKEKYVQCPYCGGMFTNPLFSREGK